MSGLVCSLQGRGEESPLSWQALSFHQANRLLLSPSPHSPCHLFHSLSSPHESVEILCLLRLLPLLCFSECSSFLILFSYTSWELHGTLGGSRNKCQLSVCHVEPEAPGYDFGKAQALLRVKRKPKNDHTHLWRNARAICQMASALPGPSQQTSFQGPIPPSPSQCNKAYRPSLETSPCGHEPKRNENVLLLSIFQVPIFHQRIYLFLV